MGIRAALLWDETTGDDPFSMVRLAVKLAEAEHDLAGAKHVAKNALSYLQYWRSQYEELAGTPPQPSVDR